MIRNTACWCCNERRSEKNEKREEANEERETRLLDENGNERRKRDRRTLKNAKGKSKGSYRENEV